jgi:hypothetical protein
MPFSRLAPLGSSFSTNMAVGELIEAGGRFRAEGQAWGTVGDEVSKKDGTRLATDIYITVNKKF